MSFPRAADDLPDCTARRLILSGRVQGVGMRPAIVRLAQRCGLAGRVLNRLNGVQIEIEGAWRQIEQFLEELPHRMPRAALVDSVHVEPAEPCGRREFAIEQSPQGGPLLTQVPRDLALCDDCRREVADPTNRRAAYPFTSCTNCGPRDAVLLSMPYERGQTTMARFTLCPACRDEYTNPANRRFHAQTNACPVCGPHCWCADPTGKIVACREAAVQVAIRAILGGEIVAVRGLGGYQLMCDATNSAVVARLRERKRRPHKPLAVLVADLDEVDRLAEVGPAARQALADPANPIVLLPARPGNRLAPGIHPGLNDVGVMLPTTPLHWLLARQCGRPLVATSGNRNGEPLVIEPRESASVLAEIADWWLHHDRPIASPLDDSVVRIIAGRPVTLRLARGLGPLTLDLSTGFRGVAVGGHQKAAVAVANGGQAALLPHIGDLDALRAREEFIQRMNRGIGLYGVEQPVWIHDLHPDYFSTRCVQELPGDKIAVQHHHAHVAAGMIEAGWLDREVLGVAFDGTGFGPDGMVWGGEFLRATAASFRRVAHLRPFRLLGGAAAIAEPLRIAAALTHDAFGLLDESQGAPPRLAARAASLRPLFDRPRFSPSTTSVGRLFDGVAALALELDTAGFEGRPAMLLEAVADSAEPGQYSFALVEGQPLQLDWRPMLRDLLADCALGVPPGRMAMRFHRGLAAAVVAVCRRFSPLPVVLSGGVFQNRLLTELIAEGMARGAQPLGLPGLIPPNDGGLAAGQLAVGLAQAASNTVLKGAAPECASQYPAG